MGGLRCSRILNAIVVGAPSYWIGHFNVQVPDCDPFHQSSMSDLGAIQYRISN
jgi:hypothetical protein